MTTTTSTDTSQAQEANHMHRKPTAPTALVDAPADGPSVAMTVTIEGYDHAVTSCALLGPGRDHLTREDALAVANEFQHPVSCDVSKQYETVLELVNDFPQAHLNGTARRMLAAERVQDDYRKAVAQWEADVAAAGLEPCGRCGGAGGWKGWPGFTCYGCGGAGVETPKAVA